MTYYYGNIDGLIGPSTVRSIKVNYRHISGTSIYIGNWHSGILSDIRVYGVNPNGNSKTTDEIYSVTIHELTHAAHFAYIGMISYVFVKPYIYESWADAVQWYLTRKEYPIATKYHRKIVDRNGKEYDEPNSFNRQYWALEADTTKTPIVYTSLFIDLIDDNNQFDYYSNTSLFYPKDNVKGYSMAFLNTTLQTVNNIRDLKRVLLTSNIPNGATEQGIVDLFTVYLEFEKREENKYKVQ